MPGLSSEMPCDGRPSQSRESPDRWATVERRSYIERTFDVSRTATCTSRSFARPLIVESSLRRRELRTRIVESRASHCGLIRRAPCRTEGM